MYVHIYPEYSSVYLLGKYIRFYYTAAYSFLAYEHSFEKGDSSLSMCVL